MKNHLRGAPRAILITAVTVGAAAALAVLVLAQGLGPPSPQPGLRYRFVGGDGNRAIAVVGEPGNPLVAYVGAASGGLFKTADAGATWTPIFDRQTVSSVASLAIPAGAPNVVWAGTGETFLIRPAHAMGNGIYRSDDAGRTWQHLGLEKTGRIGRIAIDPHDPNVVFACALGHGYGPQPERGVFRTTDGGRTWEHVLKVDEKTGCADLAIDPSNPRTIFAGMWQLEIKTWGLNSGGPGGGVYVSRDRGATWQKLAGRGLPPADHPVGKTAVAIARSNPMRVYALIEDTTPTLYRSDDGGETWRAVNQNHVMSERSPYYTRFAVSPDDPNRLYFASVSWSVSADGGETLLRGETAAGGDNHDIWIDPFNGDRIMVAHDGGASISLNRGRTYERVVLPIAQMYHVTTDNEVPYHVYGNRQDGGSYRGPSRNVAGGGFGGGGIPLGLWRGIGGCESGWGIPDPADSAIVWSGCYDGQLDRIDMRTGQARSVDVWPDATYGWKPADVKYRWHWTFPIAISPHDHNRVYVGSQVVHATADGGQSWQVISPDLTLNDKTHQQNSGGITTDNLMTYDGALLFAIAESPVEKGLIWTGSNDGQVNLTRDGGKVWTNVTPNIKGLPPLGTIANVEPSRFDAGTAYIAVDLHQVANFDPHIYRTTDYGKTWTFVGGGIPKSESSFVHVVREDPVRRGMLFAGTDNAVYVSYDDGGTWSALQYNLPPAPVYWLTVQPQFHDLVVATYGRGFWILDDITPLRLTTAEVRSADAYLFPPRQAYRFRPAQDGIKTATSFSNGENPPEGADLNYALKQPAARVEIVIAGPDGKTIRTLTGPGQAGLNRVWWDLRYDGQQPVKLWNPPVGSPWIPLGPDGWRPLVSWSRAQVAPIVPPGTYTVTLKAAGKELTQSLKVVRDPRSPGSDQDIQAQVALALDVRNELNEAGDMITRLEWTRRQLRELRAMLADDARLAAIRKDLDAVERGAIDLENVLEDTTLTGQSEDSFRAPMGLYSRMCAVAGNMIRTDHRPTDQQVAVHKEHERVLGDVRRRLDDFGSQEIAAFNALLKSKGILVMIRP